MGIQEEAGKREIPEASSIILGISTLCSAAKSNGLVCLFHRYVNVSTKDRAAKCLSSKDGCVRHVSEPRKGIKKLKLSTVVYRAPKSTLLTEH